MIQLNLRRLTFTTSPISSESTLTAALKSSLQIVTFSVGVTVVETGVWTFIDVWKGMQNKMLLSFYIIALPTYNELFHHCTLHLSIPIYQILKIKQLISWFNIEWKLIFCMILGHFQHQIISLEPDFKTGRLPTLTSGGGCLEVTRLTDTGKGTNSVCTNCWMRTSQKSTFIIIWKRKIQYECIWMENFRPHCNDQAICNNIYDG